MEKSFCKKLGFLIASLGLTASLVACGGGDDDTGGTNGDDDTTDDSTSEQAGPEPDGDDIVLTFWAWPGFGLEDLIAEYNENTDGVHIELQEGDYNDVHQNLITALAAGSGAPDITAIDEGYLDRMHENSQHFYNLYDFGIGDLRDEYLEFKWDQATNVEDDFMIGVPTDVGPMVMAYRMDLFEEAGLPTDPEEVAAQMSTWEEYIEAGHQLNDATGVKMFNTISDFYIAVREQGDIQYFDENFEYVGDQSEQNTRAWDLAVSATDLSMNINRHTPEWGAALAAGDFATVFLPPWMLQNIKNDAPDTEGLWNITFMPEGSGNFGGSFLALPQQGDHPEEAYDFITWVMSPENQLRIFQNSGPFPSTPSVYDDPSIQELQDEFFTNPELGQIYAEAAQQIIAGIKGPHHGTVNELKQDALGTVEDGTDPETAWENVNEEVRRQISR
ncbi:ABC transporter substrate-binding protein [Evansella cellulosilytica]|uniref:Extracellular solute-binding protein family 1 n=1 Tax=Evansella cellulosilytica (strain ATCC 21833 / DSM 2522 / FERM P-1141 / JCM 9156 / N-4) TaxID=649639 RepID=E6TQN2_EVAC2|nr:extracellular solute-binding protein [Evansella cellulosilytica]ADU30543.1 extracellular solute-binding protein family 1 [Evansella cellulosilytica DSM 2522]